MVSRDGVVNKLGWGDYAVDGMNFLAHLYLTDVDGGEMVGGLLPDLVRGRVPAGLADSVQWGVANHRKVDAFTDTHPMFNRSRSRLRESQGRFAGILTDVFYDHFLSVSWGAYHPEPLEGFIDRAHDWLLKAEGLMPEAMRPVVRRMVEQRWLSCYATDDGLRQTLAWMSFRFRQRTGRVIDLTGAVEALVEHREGLAADFELFFPELIAYVGVDHRTDNISRSMAWQG